MQHIPPYNYTSFTVGPIAHNVAELVTHSNFCFKFPQSHTFRFEVHEGLMNIPLWTEGHTEVSFCGIYSCNG
jgi:hypothetical protein